MRPSLSWLMRITGLALSLTLVSSVGFAQSGEAEVSGWVADKAAALKSGKYVSIAGASVELSTNESPNVVSTKTDKNGAYHFSSIGVGASAQCVVHITAQGFYSWWLTFTVSSDKSIELSTLLEPEHKQPKQ
jgi:hypothetical protein